MIPELGEWSVLGALVAATFGSVVGFAAGYTRSLTGWTLARRAAYTFAALMIVANLLMVYALVTNDYSVQYVSEVGSNDTPLYFTIVSLWASLNGSILFWGGILAVYTGAFLWWNGTRHREYMPYTLGMLMAVSVFFTLLVASVANPFTRVSPVPLDGPGPNPLLQNHWLMAVHPPTLYLGYVGMVVPYAMICAALLAGRLDSGWMVPLRRWMMIPWTFLTVGIILGGWWSYGVLGWGGPWAWDPVENASFHPWLTGTAFIHSAMVLQRRGALRVWTLVLGMATFLLTLVGTFMTRSGVFNSVHSFTQSAIGPVFLVFIAISMVFSIVLLALREHTLAIDQDSHEARTSLMASFFGTRLHPLGREFSILLQNAVFTTFTFTVLLGTLYPLVVEAVQDRRVSVGEPYFDRWALPLGIVMVFLMGVGPALPWGRMSGARVVRKLTPAVGAGVVLAGIFGALGYAGPYMTTTAFLCGFAFQANFSEFLTPVRARWSRGESAGHAVQRVAIRSRRRLGGHIAHYGVILAVLSLALYKGYKLETDVTLRPGESADLGVYTAKFTKAAVDEQPHRSVVKATFDVLHYGEQVAVLEPSLNYYPRQREPIFTPDLYSRWGSDFYLSLVELEPNGRYVVVRLIHTPGILWLWVAPGVIAFGAMLSIWPSRRRAAQDAPTGAVAGAAK